MTATWGEVGALIQQAFAATKAERDAAIRAGEALEAERDAAITRIKALEEEVNGLMAELAYNGVYPK